MSDDPFDQLDFIENSTRLKLSFLFAFCPSLRKFNRSSCLCMTKPLRSLDHDSSLFTLSHVLNSSPQAVRHLRVTQGELKWLLLVDEDFTL